MEEARQPHPRRIETSPRHSRRPTRLDRPVRHLGDKLQELAARDPAYLLALEVLIDYALARLKQ